MNMNKNRIYHNCGYCLTHGGHNKQDKGILDEKKKWDNVKSETADKILDDLLEKLKGTIYEDEWALLKIIHAVFKKNGVKFPKIDPKLYQIVTNKGDK